LRAGFNTKTRRARRFFGGMARVVRDHERHERGMLVLMLSAAVLGSVARGV
jgi:hypothetical protein